jgi:large subunit ribosomal protein LP2
MKYIAAYLLLVLGGNKTPSADDVKGVLSSVGVDVEDEKLTKLLADLKDKNIDDVIEGGLQKLSSVPSGGSSSGGASSGNAAEEKKEEEEEEEEEEEVAMGNLMGGDDEGW